MRNSMLVLIVLLSAASCGGSSSPASPTETSSSAQSILVVFTPVGGTYTAQLNNQTYTAAGGFIVDLPVGMYQISGSFQGSGFGVGFAAVAIGAGGVQSGSLRSLSGPSPQVSPCTITYFNIDTPSVPRSFQLQFQVTASVGSACQGVQRACGGARNQPCFTLRRCWNDPKVNAQKSAQVAEQSWHHCSVGPLKLRCYWWSHSHAFEDR